MNALISSIAPIFLLIALGYLLRSRNIFADAFWANLERLVFYFLFPSLLVTSIGGADLDGLEIAPMASVLMGGTLAISAGALWIRPRLAITGHTFASVFQGVTRPNTYLGLSMAVALYGQAGIALIAICIVCVIPLVNVLAVIVHLRWAPDMAQPSTNSARQKPWASAAIASLQNPVIIACLLGAALNVSSLGLPPVLGPTLELAGRAALPLGLMAVGAGLTFSAIKDQNSVLLWTTLIKMGVSPFLTWALCAMFSIEGVSASICILFSALPVSATSYVMARQMGGNSTLMAGIVTATTLTSVLTLPILATFFL